MTIKLSLITVAYNSLHTLQETVNSVLTQEFKDIEYIIIDGASTDGTVNWLEKNSSKITKWISEEDSGIYDALNKGLRMAQGEIVGFLHADDVFADTTILKKIVQQFEEEKADLLYGDLEYVSDKKPSKVVRYWKSGQFDVSKLRKGWMPPHPTVYFKQSLITTFGYFDTSYSISADYDWLLRVLNTPGLKVVYLPKVLVKMKIGGASNKSLSNIIRKSYEDYRALKSNKVGSLFTLISKNTSKLGQFFYRKNC